jgi:hypothetical protein
MKQKHKHIRRTQHENIDTPLMSSVRHQDMSNPKKVYTSYDVTNYLKVNYLNPYEMKNE